jgi:hypothetical protein
MHLSGELLAERLSRFDGKRSKRMNLKALMLLQPRFTASRRLSVRGRAHGALSSCETVPLAKHPRISERQGGPANQPSLTPLSGPQNGPPYPSSPVIPPLAAMSWGLRFSMIAR